MTETTNAARAIVSSANDTIYNFLVNDVPFQILGGQSLYDLVDVIVEDQLDESADDHLWNVHIGDREYDGRVMISALPLVTAGTLLKLTDDYGSTCYFSITFTGSEESNRNRGDFPRRTPPTSSVMTRLHRLSTCST